MIDKESDLREGPFAFMDLLHATTGGGVRFMLNGSDVRYRCLVCDATFEQTTEGYRSLREHEMQHGRADCVSLSELDGKTLRIVAWASKSKQLGEMITPEIWAVDDQNGIVYHLSNSFQNDKVWKWRINGRHFGALGPSSAVTPNDPVCP